MKKQSSVEWLMQQIALKYGAFQAIAFYEENFKEFEQAKQMHKEEIIESYYMGDRYSCCGCYDSSTEEEAEDYYNEIFKEDDKRIGD